LADFNRAMTASEDLLDESEDVAHAALGEVDDAAVDHDVRVWTVQAEQVRESGDRHAEVRARVARPLLVQLDTAAAADLHGRQEPGRLETGAVDDDVDGVFFPVSG